MKQYLGRYEVSSGYVAVVKRVVEIHGMWVLKGAIISGNIFFMHGWDLKGNSITKDKDFKLTKKL